MIGNVLTVRVGNSVDEIWSEIVGEIFGWKVEKNGNLEIFSSAPDVPTRRVATYVSGNWASVVSSFKELPKK